MAHHVPSHVGLYNRSTNSLTEGILCTISMRYFQAHVPTAATYRIEYTTLLYPYVYYITVGYTATDKFWFRF